MVIFEDDKVYRRLIYDQQMSQNICLCPERNGLEAGPGRCRSELSYPPTRTFCDLAKHNTMVYVSDINLVMLNRSG